jgi:hypothetical protein
MTYAGQKFYHLQIWRFQHYLSLSQTCSTTSVWPYRSVIWISENEGLVWFLCVISGIRRDVDEIALFCDITRRWVLVIYRRFGTTYRSHLQGPMGCPETSVQNSHSTLHNIAQERRSNLVSVKFSIVGGGGGERCLRWELLHYYNLISSKSTVFWDITRRKPEIKVSIIGLRLYMAPKWKLKTVLRTKI